MGGLGEEINRLQLFQGITPLRSKKPVEIACLCCHIAAEISQELGWLLEDGIHHGDIQTATRWIHN